MVEEKGQNQEAEAPVVPKKSQKETEAQKTAFELYYNMGEKRSLEAVANSCGKSTRTIGEWSRKFQWKDRILQKEIEETAEKGSTANAVLDVKAEYRKVIVGLIFLRYISSAFKKKYDRLERSRLRIYRTLREWLSWICYS